MSIIKSFIKKHFIFTIVVVHVFLLISCGLMISDPLTENPIYCVSFGLLIFTIIHLLGYKFGHRAFSIDSLFSSLKSKNKEHEYQEVSLKYAVYGIIPAIVSTIISVAWFCINL